MTKQKPLYVLRLQPTHPDVPPGKDRKFHVRRIGVYDNTVPGAEMAFVYGKAGV